MIKAVIFDWDGVIADSLEVQFKVTKEICRICDKKFPFKSSEDMRHGFIEPYYDLYESFGFEWSKDEKCIIDNYKRLSKENKIPVFKDVIEVVKKLKKNDVFLAIASNNKEDVLSHKIEENNLQGIFDIVITEDQITRIKPDPECINVILLKYNLKPEEVLYVGDMPADVQAAKNAGVKSVAVTWGWIHKEKLEKEQPDFLIEKPEELLEIVKNE